MFCHHNFSFSVMILNCGLLGSFLYLRVNLAKNTNWSTVSRLLFEVVWLMNSESCTLRFCCILYFQSYSLCAPVWTLHLRTLSLLRKFHFYCLCFSPFMLNGFVMPWINIFPGITLSAQEYNPELGHAINKKEKLKKNHDDVTLTYVMTVGDHQSSPQVDNRSRYRTLFSIVSLD